MDTFLIAATRPQCARDRSHHRFRATAMMSIAINVATIGLVLWLNHNYGICALVFGTAAGVIAQLLIQLPAVLSIRFRFQIDLHHPGLKHMWLLLGPVVVGSAAGQVALFSDRLFRIDAFAGKHGRHELCGEGD